MKCRQVLQLASIAQSRSYISIVCKMRGVSFSHVRQQLAVLMQHTTVVVTFNESFPAWKGHPNSVDTLLKLDEDTVLTGSSDGIIRCVNLIGI